MALKKSKVPLNESHPHLMEEWDFDKNEIRPEEVTYGSAKKAWWSCKKCGYSWRAVIKNRAKRDRPRGCPSCARKVVSGTNNLGVTNPGLCKEWHPTRNGTLTTDKVLSGTDRKVWWLCPECGYEWCTSVSHRASTHGSKTACPSCSGRVTSGKNRLILKCPHLLEEWDFEKNEDIRPEEISYGSHRKVWWRCVPSGHRWRATARGRYVGHGCPYCSGRLCTPENSIAVNFARLLEEWDWEKNMVSPYSVSRYSDKKLWWVCVEGHSWQSTVHNRINGSGCSYCSGRYASPGNNLLDVFPDIAAEWDYGKNEGSPVDYAPRSAKRVWWKCPKCAHSWRASPATRSRSGCPSCSNKVVTDKNSLLFLRPNIAREWSDRNDISPADVVPGSGRLVWWRCIKESCGYEWRTQVFNRAVRGTECPRCSFGGNVSQISQSWLDMLNVESIFREFIAVPLTIKVDGYDPGANIAYEFLGDLWHGNPEIYGPRDINPFNKKTHGQLYRETYQRFCLLEEAGYKVVYIWEKDFREGKDSRVFNKNNKL